MKLQEILDEIAEKYPHDLSNDSVIRKINLIQNELFRTTFRINTMTQYDILKDVFAYPLPATRSNIIDVLVNDQEYNYQDVKKGATVPFYYFTDGNELGIYPTPDKDSAGGLIIFHYREPRKLTTSDLGAEPELDRDFHMLLVYGALAQIGEVFQDTAMINNYTAKYNGLIEEFQRVNDEVPDYPVIEDVMGVWQ
ncbi:phage adaptor protein [Paenibacillus lactis]|uniref:phage adaptor protein n=1 Tax=Paenibacillus lactis TaxID=228574 RepID=UPI0036C346F2